MGHELAWQVQVFSAEPEGLHSTHRTHTRKERSNFSKLASNLHMHALSYVHLHPPPHTHTEGRVFYVNGCLTYMYVCVPRASSAHRSQKKMLDSLELEFQTVVNHHGANN